MSGGQIRDDKGPRYEIICILRGEIAKLQHTQLAALNPSDFLENKPKEMASFLVANVFSPAGGAALMSVGHLILHFAPD